MCWYHNPVTRPTADSVLNQLKGFLTIPEPHKMAVSLQQESTLSDLERHKQPTLSFGRKTGRVQTGNVELIKFHRYNPDDVANPTTSVTEL